MGISAIRSNEFIQPIYDPQDPLEPIKKVVKRDPKEYSQSTLQDTEHSEDLRPMFFPDTDPASRPKLESPSSGSKNIDRHGKEVQLIRAFFEAMAKQRDSKGTNIEINQESVKRNQSANDEIRKEFFKKVDDLIQQKKKSGSFDWIIAVSGLGSLALTIGAAFVTGGASLTVQMTINVLTGVLSITSGGLTLYKGYLDYDNKQIIGHLESKKHEREMNNQKIEFGMDEMHQHLEEIFENIRKASELENNRYQASLNI